MSRPSLIFTTIPNLGIYGLLGVFAVIISRFSQFDRARDYVLSAGGTNSEEYFDFIIVGAGSAGSVLANRLSRKFKVLVLEAGGQPNPLMAIPALAIPLELHPELDWMYYTVPQSNACFGLHSHRSRWPRGKAEGGSSNLNGLIYLRGHPKDFNSWAESLEDSIWNYRSVTKFYKRFENFNDNNPKHGHGGEQNVEMMEPDLLTGTFLKAGEELGYPVADLNSHHVEGFTPLTFTSRRGIRWEDYLAFLKPAKESPVHRLSVYKYSKVLKVLIDKNKKAYGVEYRRHGTLWRAYASKEVILSAGAINSPQLLMLSGIGPRSLLNSFNIPVISNLPVGQNLQDHVGTIIGMFSVDPPITASVKNSLNLETFVKYVLDGSGAVGSTFVKAVGALASSYRGKSANSSQQDQNWPDIQLTLFAASQPSFFEPILQFFNIRPQTVQNIWTKTAGLNTFQIFMINSRPDQRGVVRIVSSNPEVPPLINPKYLQTKRDVQVSIEGMKMAIKLVTSTKAFRRVGGKMLKIPLDPCTNFEFLSDAYLECYLRQMTLTLYHPCCTCPMGSSKDIGRVTDSNFRVVGVKNLRVIDASSFPRIPNSNLNAPTNLVGEVGSYLICKYWTGYPCH